MDVSKPDVCIRLNTPQQNEVSRRPIRDAIVRELSSFTSFLGTQNLWGRQQGVPTIGTGDIDIIDFSDVEEELAGLVVQSSFRKEESDAGVSVPTSPRALLESMVPNNASQLVRMDIILLDECPEREDLRRAAWKGCSSRNRAQVWRMLLAYEPLNLLDRRSNLEAKRKEYHEYVRVLYAPQGAEDLVLSDQIRQNRHECHRQLAQGNVEGLSKDNRKSLSAAPVEYSEFSAKTLRQIEMDLPRTHPETPIFHVEEVRNPMRRILYLFGMLNPNKNYVQGMNELLTPILVVFISDCLKETNEKGVESFLGRTELDGDLTEQQLANAEADAFWTFSRVVFCIEDNFIADQPGILRRVARLEEIVSIVDPLLAKHLAKNGNDFLQFSFRWMNCLLMRELPFGLVVKLWDALIAEEDGFSDLHVYFCAAIMTRYRAELLRMGFEKCIMFLQHLPTHNWTTHDVDVLLSQAYVWKHSLNLSTLTMNNKTQACSIRPLSR